MLTVPISPGELIDRSIILGLKVERIADPGKVRAACNQLASLAPALDSIDRAAVAELADELADVHAELWDALDKQRQCERAGLFGSNFIQLAREVTRLNDRRCVLRNQIDERLGSDAREVKEHIRL